MHRRLYRHGVIAILSMMGLSSVLWGQSPLNFVSIQPCRLVDTRNAVGTFGGPSLPPNTVRSFPILSASCGIPANAAAYSLNVTVVPPGFLGYLTVWPTGGPQPVASTINSYLGVAVANAALVSAGTNGAVSVYATNPTDVILDINGYFVPQSSSTTLSTALGAGALPASSTGQSNTAIGVSALGTNSSGAFNVGIGATALSANTTGSNNTALGTAALQANTTGTYNTGLGFGSLERNALGNANTAVGYTALFSNVASSNTALGTAALANNTTGNNNTALGFFALNASTIGGGNIGIGYGAAKAVTSGSYNIEIGNQGTSTDSNVIRIGTSGQQMSTYIAGIANSGVSGASAVLVDPVTGQLGVLLSAERFKEDVHDMDSASNALMKLHPVTFRYKQQEQRQTNGLQYGLIAEEVAKVYPDLVVYGRDGEVESVQYHELPALLLNELQKQHQTIKKLEERIAALEAIAPERTQSTIAGRE
jgi:hypothetical protein